MLWSSEASTNAAELLPNRHMIDKSVSTEPSTVNSVRKLGKPRTRFDLIFVSGDAKGRTVPGMEVTTYRKLSLSFKRGGVYQSIIVEIPLQEYVTVSFGHTKFLPGSIEELKSGWAECMSVGQSMYQRMIT